MYSFSCCFCVLCVFRVFFFYSSSSSSFFFQLLLCCIARCPVFDHENWTEIFAARGVRLDSDSCNSNSGSNGDDRLMCVGGLVCATFLKAGRWAPGVGIVCRFRPHLPCWPDLL